MPSQRPVSYQWQACPRGGGSRAGAGVPGRAEGKSRLYAHACHEQRFACIRIAIGADVCSDVYANCNYWQPGHRLRKRIGGAAGVLHYIIYAAAQIATQIQIQNILKQQSKTKNG